MAIKPGMRLQSSVSEVEVVVVRGDQEAGAALTCGGVQMVMVGEANGGTSGERSMNISEETLLGKRYVDEQSGLEVLCTKAGKGLLAYGGRTLVVKQAKQLPSSD